jgi:four helix bundle protein
MHSYHSLIVWQRAHDLCIKTLEATDDANVPRAWAVFDQLRRAVVSIEANIVEGYALGTPGYFRRHVRIAFGSAAEAECLIRIAAKRTYLRREVVKPLLTLADETLRVLFGLMRSQRRGKGGFSEQ